MAEISAAMVKELREKTGAGMMDCKKALKEADGDMSAAIDNLRKAGIAKAEKKSGRAVNQGVITSVVEEGKGVMLEALCETDFVAKNPKFQEFAEAAGKRLLDGDGDGDMSEKVAEAEKENLVSLIATIGENMQVRRAIRWESDGVIASYMHMGGRIGVMAEVGGDADAELAKDICMHVAAFNPQYVSPEDIPADVIEKEKEIAEAQLAGKPAEIIDKIISGKLNKWYTEVCLIKQPWFKDDKTCLGKLKPGAKVKRFERWEMGESL